MVRDGETIIIGGLISKEDSYGLTKVPFFGDIPLLGLAFRYKSTDKSDKELLVFITPHIVKEEGYVLTNISEREQERPKAVREKEIRTLLDFMVESSK
jgi:type II secretory pathway component GspD/PulD (secretin)